MTQKSFGLIGCPLGHSMSPFLQGRLFSAAGVQAEYRLFELAPGTLASALPALRELDGFNITIPYKSEIIPYLDEVDGTAAFFGSVNTVKNENGRLIGCSTDGEGFLFALGACGVRVDGARVLLLGYGGASRAMGGTALLSGAKSILIAGRSPDRAAPLLRDLHALANARGLPCDLAAVPLSALETSLAGESWDLLVNGTPVGMHPSPDRSPVPEDVVRRCGAVFDAVYNPDETELLRAAERAGVPAVHGMLMLCGQAAASQSFWGMERCGRDALLQLSRDAVAEMNRRFGRDA